MVANNEKDGLFLIIKLVAVGGRRKTSDKQVHQSRDSPARKVANIGGKEFGDQPKKDKAPTLFQ
jgi:hypothetical protein